MADHQDPWFLDGVSAEAREAAEAAAESAGLSLGEWLDATIRHYAGEDSDAQIHDDIVAAIQALGARLAAAETGTTQTLAPLRERLEGLSRQIDEIEDGNDPREPTNTSK